MCSCAALRVKVTHIYFMSVLVSFSTAAQQQQQMLENVKKCKNFLSTLIKLAASQPEATVSNVRDLIQGLIVSITIHFLDFEKSYSVTVL